MKIAEFLSPQAVVPDLAARTKAEVLRELAQSLTRAHPGLRSERLGRALMALKRTAGRGLTAAGVERVPVGDEGFDASAFFSCGINDGPVLAIVEGNGCDVKHDGLFVYFETDSPSLGSQDLLGSGTGICRNCMRSDCEEDDKTFVHITNRPA